MHAFLGLLHINCLNAPISPVSEINLTKIMGWGENSFVPVDWGRFVHMPTQLILPCNAVMIYELLKLFEVQVLKLYAFWPDRQNSILILIRFDMQYNRHWYSCFLLTHTHTYIYIYSQTCL